MESPKAKQRTKDQPETSPNNTHKTPKSTSTRNKRAMTRKGLKSLGLAIGLPILLTISTIYLFQLGQGYDDLVDSAWYPPMWVIHVASILSSCLMGLSAWLVWAEAGFHGPATAALPLLVITQLMLGLLWGPVVLGLGAIRLGLVFGLALVAALYGCVMGFRDVNPLAGELVVPCIAWAVLLVVMNYGLI